MKNEVNVKIFNREYRLMTDETKEYTDRLATELNRKMAELLQGTSTLSATDASAIICLECYDELVKARQSIENIRSQIKGYVDEASFAKETAEELLEENEKLKARVEQLEKEVRLRQNFAGEKPNANAKDMISQDINKALENRYPYNYGKK